MQDKPSFMSEPSKYSDRNNIKYHSYSMPECGEEIIEAVSWMLTRYDNVESEYGESYGCPYCHLIGKVKC